MNSLQLQYLARQPYAPILQQLRSFTAQRDPNTVDQLWILEHDPVFTQGQAGKDEHVLDPGVIPVVQSDRGGQVTYHGPGQLIVYFLIDLTRKKINVRNLINAIEQSVMELLQTYDISANLNRAAPGVYVDQAKICSIGLRVRKGCTYHGISLNVDMDLEPFSRINPCGYPGLEMVQLKTLVPDITMTATIDKLVPILTHNLQYSRIIYAEN